jgi:hypothetical protein
MTTPAPNAVTKVKIIEIRLTIIDTSNADQHSLWFYFSVEHAPTCQKFQNFRGLGRC